MYFKAFLVISVLNILHKHLASSVSQNWIELTKQLKNEIRKWSGRKFPSLNDSISIGYRPSGIFDYPGKNKKELYPINDTWNKYYLCMQAKHQSVRDDETTPPYAIAAFTDSSIQMDCNVCLSPENNLPDVEWYFTDKPSRMQSLLVEEDEHKQISAYTFSLNLHSVQTYHEGMYYCNLTTDADAPYFLHVLNSQNEPFVQVNTDNSKVGPYPSDPLPLAGTNLVLWNEWTHWTDCNWCGKVGKRTRIGFCKISLMKNLPEELKPRIDSTWKKQSFDVSTKIIRETEELLRIFLYGLPCRSPLLAREIRNSGTVKKYPTEIQAGFCKKPCPSDVVIEVMDRNGKVLETFNNTAGEYYIQQELPAMPVGPKRVTVYAHPGKPFVLPCPRKSGENSPVEWSVAGKIWFKDTVESISKRRITLNDLNEIVFHKVEEVDSKIYSCWQERELIAVVRLNLTETSTFIEEYVITLELYPVMMFTAIALTFSYVLAKMLLNRGKVKIATIQFGKKKSKFVQFLKDTRVSTTNGNNPSLSTNDTLTSTIRGTDFIRISAQNWENR